MPISATSTGPQCSRPGSSRWPGLRRKKVTVSLASHRRAHHRAACAVDAARQIDRDDRRAGRVDRLDHRARRPLDRPVEPGAEQRIDDERRRRRGSPASAGSTGPLQRCAASRRIALELVAVAEQQQPDRIAALGQEPGATKPSPPLLPGPATTHDRTAGGLPRDRVGDRPAGVFHQADAGRAARDRQAVGLGHLARWSAARSWRGHYRRLAVTPTIATGLDHAVGQTA